MASAIGSVVVEKNWTRIERIILLFRNRSFLVKVVKDENTDIPANDPIDYRELAAVITKGVSTCIAIYITADTIRKVVVYAISAKF